MFIEVPGSWIADIFEDDVMIYLSGQDLDAYRKGLELSLNPPETPDPNGVEAWNKTMNLVKTGVAMAYPYSAPIIALLEANTALFKYANKVSTEKLYNQLKSKKGPVLITWDTNLVNHHVKEISMSDMKEAASKYARFVKSNN